MVEKFEITQISQGSYVRSCPCVRLTLRFPRCVTAVRKDKTAEEVDTLSEIQEVVMERRSGRGQG